MNTEQKHPPQFIEEKVVLSARVNPVLKKKLTDQAKERGLTVSEYVETIVSSDFTETLEAESKIEFNKLKMIITSKEKEVEKLNGELDSISKQHLNSLKKKSSPNSVWDSQLRIEKVLASFYEKGIYTVRDKDLTGQGVPWLSIPLSGTTLYGSYKLISTSFWNESFRIEKL